MVANSPAASFAASTPDPEAATSWRLVSILIGAGVISAFQIAKAAPALPAMRIDIGLSLLAAGWTLSMLNFIAAATGIFAGSFADHVGHRRVTIAGLACLMVAGAAGSAVSDPYTLLATRFFEGFGYLAIVVSIPPLIVRATGERAARLVLAIWSSHIAIGAAIMISVSPLILPLYGWRGLWGANVLIVGLYAVVFMRATRHLVEQRPPPPVQSVVAVAHRMFRNAVTVAFAPGPLTLAGCFAAFTVSFMVVFGFLPTFLFEDMGIAIATAAFLTAISWVAHAAGIVVAGILRQRNVPRWALILLGSAVMGMAAIGIYDVDLDPNTRYAMCLLYAIFGGFVPASLFGAVPVFAPRPNLVATTSGIVLQGSNLGILVGPPFIAAIVTAGGGWQAAPVLPVVCAGIGVVLALLIGRLERQLND